MPSALSDPEEAETSPENANYREESDLLCPLCCDITLNGKKQTLCGHRYNRCKGYGMVVVGCLLVGTLAGTGIGVIFSCVLLHGRAYEIAEDLYRQRATFENRLADASMARLQTRHTLTV